MKWLVIGLIGLVIIVVGIYVVRNVSTAPTTVIEQRQSEETMKQLVAQGIPPTKKGPFGKVDFFHMGSGEAVVYATSAGPVLQFENFSVTAGPDLFVYLAKTQVEATLNPDLGDFVSLGKLKATKGNQIYSLPADASDYQTVIIWCRAFGVQFTQARLN